MAVYLVLANNCRLSIEDLPTSPFSNLIRLLQGMKSRFEGVQYVSEVVDAINKALARMTHQWQQEE